LQILFGVGARDARPEEGTLAAADAALAARRRSRLRGRKKGRSLL